MAKAKGNDQEYLAEQYHDSSNLQARIDLHQRFSVNPYGWFRWVFDQFHLPAQSRLLELGCGPGMLWVENLDRIPAGWEIILSDFSPGMLREAQVRLEDKRQFQFRVIDGSSVPFPFEDACMHAVIANHMIYHVSNKPVLFSQIRRILIPGGRLFATTVGERHLSEIDDLLNGFNPGLSVYGNMVESFTLENGAEQLAQWFSQVEQYRYEDELRVTEADSLIDYILSGWIDLSANQIEPFRAYIEQYMAAHGGVIRIPKISGIFVAALAAGGEDV